MHCCDGFDRSLLLFILFLVLLEVPVVGAEDVDGGTEVAYSFSPFVPCSRDVLIKHWGADAVQHAAVAVY